MELSKKAGAVLKAQEAADRTLHVKGGCWYDGKHQHLLSVVDYFGSRVGGAGGGGGGGEW
jgi:hypothetical protein